MLLGMSLSSGSSGGVESDIIFDLGALAQPLPPVPDEWKPGTRTKTSAKAKAEAAVEAAKDAASQPAQTPLANPQEDEQAAPKAPQEAKKARVSRSSAPSGDKARAAYAKPTRTPGKRDLPVSLSSGCTHRHSLPPGAETELAPQLTLRPSQGLVLGDSDGNSPSARSPRLDREDGFSFPVSRAGEPYQLLA